MILYTFIVYRILVQLMQDTFKGYKVQELNIQNTGYMIQDTGYRIQDTGFQSLPAGNPPVAGAISR